MAAPRSWFGMRARLFAPRALIARDAILVAHRDPPERCPRCTPGVRAEAAKRRHGGRRRGCPLATWPRVWASRSRHNTDGFPPRLGEHPRHDASPPAGWPCGRPLGAPRLNHEILCKALRLTCVYPRVRRINGRVTRHASLADRQAPRPGRYGCLARVRGDLRAAGLPAWPAARDSRMPTRTTSARRSFGRWPGPSTAGTRARGSFRGWLSRIARNLLINFLTRRRHQPRGSGTTSVQDLLEAQPAADPSATALFEAEYEKHLFRWAADEVRGEFAPTTWQAFWQTAVEGRSPARSRGRARTIGRGRLYRSQPGPGSTEAPDRTARRRGGGHQ